MGFRFRKSFKVLPGVRLNLSKSGLSTSLGGRGATINLGKRGTRATVGIPGTGLSYSTSSTGRAGASGGGAAGRQNAAGAGWGCLALVLLLLLAGYTCSRSGTTDGNTTAAGATAGTTTPAYVTAASLNCRKAPSATAAVIASLKRAEQVAVVEREGAWARLDRLADSCWVSSAFLSDTPSAGERPSNALLSAPNAAASVIAGAHNAGNRAASSRSHAKSQRRGRSRRSRPSSGGFVRDGSCPCSGGSVCIGPRGGRYCITSGGNKRYGV